MTGLGRQAGLSYVEVTLAAVVLSLALVPALQSIQAGSDSSVAHADLLSEYNALQSRLDYVRQRPFSELLSYTQEAGDATSPVEAYSDSDGDEPQILVYLSVYDAADEDGDGDVFTVADDNADGDDDVYTADQPENLLRLLWLRTQVAGSDAAVTTLVRR
ncbi:hypothetical protein Q4485_08330 [Granulosicoccaceae sp. 1_MG-2023]|nr:hypothetical protein [Granulosicoccaceae sp. 1_MG-2023]